MITRSDRILSAAADLIRSGESTDGLDALERACSGRRHPDITVGLMAAMENARVALLRYVESVTGQHVEKMAQVEALAGSPEQLAAWLEGAARMAVPA